MPTYTSIASEVREITRQYPGIASEVRELTDDYTSIASEVRRIFANFKETKKWYAGCTLSGVWFGGKHGSGWTTNSDGSQNPTYYQYYANFTADYISLRQEGNLWSLRGAVCFDQKLTSDTKYLHVTIASAVGVGLCIELYSSWSNAMDYHSGLDNSEEANYTPPNESFKILQSGELEAYVDVNADGRNTGKTLWFMINAYQNSSKTGYVSVTSVRFTNKKEG